LLRGSCFFGYFNTYLMFDQHITTHSQEQQ